MRARLLTASLLVLGATAAHADESFDSRAASATRIRHLDDIVWAFTAACDEGTDTNQRQCRRLRDTRAAQLSGATLLVDADRDAFSVGAWSAAKKSTPLTLSSCIRCKGVEHDGKTWYLVGSRDGTAGPKVKGGKVEAGLLVDSARPTPDAAAAKRLAASAKHAKVQLLVKVPAKPTWSDAGKQGLALDVLGYRVYSPCDGKVVLANPSSASGPVDKKACAELTGGTKPAAPSSDDAAGELTPAQVKAAVKPVIREAKACYRKYQVAGKAKLRMAIAADGSLAEYEQQGDFVNTPTGSCIDAAVKKAAFPASSKPRTALAVPIALP